jgi:predicted O-linked N-acetylglucosamine transferase (SPINDLY family)
LPRYDEVLVEIARRLGSCQLVFFADVIPNFSTKLQIRLGRAFERANLNFDSYVRFIPRQAPSHFFGLMERADILLDTIGFSGFNTAMQAVQCGLPMVTKEGQYMRGRFASAILKRMNLRELVVRSEVDYVQLAVSLASDAQERRRISKQMQTARDILYNDMSPIEGLQDFLIGKVREASR